MDFFIDLFLFAGIMIGTIALLGWISSLLMKPFGRRKATESAERTLHTRTGWRQVGGKNES